LKKPAGSVRFGFGFISKKTKKPNRTETEKKNRKKNQAKPEKPSQTEKNRVKTEKNRAKPV
jgi:hypothetical protein